MKNTATLDEAIDKASFLPPEQQEMLIEILRNHDDSLSARAARGAVRS